MSYPRVAKITAGNILERFRAMAGMTIAAAELGFVRQACFIDVIDLFLMAFVAVQKCQI